MNSRRVPPAYWIACMFIAFLTMVGMVSTLFLFMPAADAFACAMVGGGVVIAVAFGMASWKVEG